MDNRYGTDTEASHEDKDTEGLRGLKDLAGDEGGMGTIEVILIIVVLIGLVIIFKKQLRGLVEKVFVKINSDTDSVIS
jgi:hypothetical protein